MRDMAGKLAMVSAGCDLNFKHEGFGCEACE